VEDDAAGNICSTLDRNTKHQTLNSETLNTKPQARRMTRQAICPALVRGPNVVPGVPPLSADQCGAVFGLGMIMSRFGPQAGGSLSTST